MKNFELFNTDEKKVLSRSLALMMMHVHPDKNKNRDKWDETDIILNRLRTELVNWKYVPFRLAQEIKWRQPKPKIIVNWQHVQVDRWCNIHNPSELRGAVLDIITETWSHLGITIDSIPVMRSRKVDMVANSHLKIMENIQTIIWCVEIYHKIEKHKNWYWNPDINENLTSSESLEDIMSYIFKLRPWLWWKWEGEIQHVANVVQEYIKNMQKEILRINPYSCNNDFNFPYTSIEEVFIELGYNENKIAKLKEKNSIFKFNYNNLSERDRIWILVSYPESGWDSIAHNLSEARHFKDKCNLPDKVFDFVINRWIEAWKYISILNEADKIIKSWSIKSNTPGLINNDDLSQDIIDRMQYLFVNEDRFNKAHSKDFTPLRRYINLSLLEHRRSEFRIENAKKAWKWLVVVGTGLVTLSQEEQRIKTEFEAIYVEINMLDSNYFQKYHIPSTADDLVNFMIENHPKNAFREINNLKSFFESVKEGLETGKIIFDRDHSYLPSEWRRLAGIIIDKLYPGNDFIIGGKLLELEIAFDKSLLQISKHSSNFFEEQGISDDPLYYRDKLNGIWLDYGKKLHELRYYFSCLADSFESLGKTEDYKQMYIDRIETLSRELLFFLEEELA